MNAKGYYIVVVKGDKALSTCVEEETTNTLLK